jgi:hypothetical protein
MALVVPAKQSVATHVSLHADSTSPWDWRVETLGVRELSLWERILP